MASLSSVHVHKKDITKSNAFPIFILIASIIWFLVSLSGGLGVGTITSFIFIVISAFWIKSIKTEFDYILVLTTSSGETSVLHDTDPNMILPVEDAINKAIIHRG